MEIKIECPTCDQHIALDDSMRGSSLDCPSCGATLRVPEASKTRPKSRTFSNIHKNPYVLWSIIALLIVTNVLAVSYWRLDERKLSRPVDRGDLTAGRGVAPAGRGVFNPGRGTTPFVRGAIGVRPTIVPTTPAAPAQAVSPANAAWFALRNNNLPQLQQALDAHPEILNQHYGPSQTTLLISAAFLGNADALGDLLKRNAEVNAKNGDGRTALYDCILGQGTKAMAAMLLDHKADFTIADNSGETPLKLATERKRQDIVELLQQRGAKN